MTRKRQSRPSHTRRRAETPARRSETPIPANRTRSQNSLSNPRSLAPADLRYLQRTIGNRAVRHLIQSRSQHAIQRGPEDNNGETKKDKSNPVKEPKGKTALKKPYVKGTIRKKAQDLVKTYQEFKKEYKEYPELAAHHIESNIANLSGRIEKLNVEINSYFDKAKTSIKETKLISVRDLVRGVAGRFVSPSSAEYLQIYKKLGKYHDGKILHQRNPDLWKTNLEALGTAVEAWSKKYGSKFKSRANTRKTIKQLTEQVEQGLKKNKTLAPEGEKAKELQQEADLFTQARHFLTEKRSRVWRQRVIGKRKVAHLANLAHLLEAHDFPKHRGGEFLNPLFREWLGQGHAWSPKKGPPPKEFYQFVDEQEKKRGKKFERVTFLDMNERKAFQLKIGTGGVTYKEGQRPFPGGMYVMSPDGQFYGGPEKVRENGSVKTFHHSSFLSGMPVAAAGHLKAPAGEWLMTIDLESGHYQPLTSHIVKALKRLKTLLGSLDKVGVQPFASEFHKFSKSLQGTSFLKELTWLKSNNWEEADPLDVRKNAPWMSTIISNKNRKTDAFEQLKLGIHEV